MLVVELNKFFTLKKSKKKQHTEKQHFIPETYIKQFYDDEYKVWRLNVKYKNIKDFTSAQIFYGLKQYDLKYGNSTYRGIESNYADLEDTLGKVYKIMKEGNFIDVLKNNKDTNRDVFYIFKVAIAFQHFRNIHVDYSEHIKNNLSLTSIYNERKEYFIKNFSFIDMKELKYIDRKLKISIKKDKESLLALTKAIQYIFLPILLTDFNKGNLKIAKFKKRYLISGDRPIVYGSQEELYQFSNFMYPLSADTLIYSLGNKITEDIVSNHKKINQMIYDNSVEYAISHDKSILKEFV
ncbi:DUF4238 domain-containing protein [Serratia marcescens]|uniref:DUF4238 domain-containing protein n=1 Tax=Serratia marcescens TaxID=615 RepID=UPI003F7F5922